MKLNYVYVAKNYLTDNLSGQVVTRYYYSSDELIETIFKLFNGKSYNLSKCSDRIETIDTRTYHVYKMLLSNPNNYNDKKILYTEIDACSFNNEEYKKNIEFDNLIEEIADICNNVRDIETVKLCLKK